MFNAKQYRAKAAEFAERSRSSQVPDEIIEYRNLGRRFAELADNEEWVERNRGNTLHAPGEGPPDPEDDRQGDIAKENEQDDDAARDRRLCCLGAAVILHWDSLPSKLRKELFDSARDMGDLLPAKLVRADIARSLHVRKGHPHGAT
jgi:hypothetical protein